ncbi:MAG: ribosome maturation factor RimM [Vulcanimicrobiaceae bacterium]
MRHHERDADVTVTSVREHKGRLLISLQDVASADQGQAFIGAALLAPREAFVLQPGEYLDEDLIGCTLCDRSGTDLGSVSSVEHYPGQDLLLVNGARVPLVRAFIKDIDVLQKRITVDLPRGLLDPHEGDEA